jgi:endo-1,4-beta-mannosidase
MTQVGLVVRVHILEVDTNQSGVFTFVGDPRKQSVTVPLTVILVECNLDISNIESIYINDDEVLINLEEMLTSGQGTFDKDVTVYMELAIGARVGDPVGVPGDDVTYYACGNVMKMCRVNRAVSACM